MNSRNLTYRIFSFQKSWNAGYYESFVSNNWVFSTLLSKSPVYMRTVLPMIKEKINWKIRPLVKPQTYFPGGNRKYEVKITRLHVGHLPQCSSCRMFLLTMKHFLTNCRTTRLKIKKKIKCDYQMIPKVIWGNNF